MTQAPLGTVPAALFYSLVWLGFILYFGVGNNAG
jgi:hypothetical protein